MCGSRLTGKNVEVSTVNPGQAIYPKARVEVEVAGYQTEIVVGVHEGLKYDVLLGGDFPYLWEVEFREVNLATCAMVKTWQATKQESVLKPDKQGEVVTADDLTKDKLKETSDRWYQMMMFVKNVQKNWMTTVLETQILSYTATYYCKGYQNKINKSREEG